MKMLAEYVEHSLRFELMASEASDPEVKERMQEQAKAYRKLAEERAKRLEGYANKAPALGG
jgi:flagellar motor component MotA